MSVQQDGWIGVDLDGTLAYFDHWRGSFHIGKPIPAMVDRVKKWIVSGANVRIFTARTTQPDYDESVVQDWLAKSGIGPLPVTNQKDFALVEFWDDLCVQVRQNTGQRVDGEI